MKGQHPKLMGCGKNTAKGKFIAAKAYSLKEKNIKPTI